MILKIVLYVQCLTESVFRVHFRVYRLDQTEHNAICNAILQKKKLLKSSNY